jgi:hypothetical protein
VRTFSQTFVAPEARISLLEWGLSVFAEAEIDVDVG